MQGKEGLMARSKKGLKAVGALTGFRVVFQTVTQLALVRLLLPEAFGIIAFASIILELFKLLTSLHAGKLIIQRRDNVREYLNTAFTIELILSAIAAAVIILFSPFLMRLLDKPEMIVYTQVLAFSLIINVMITPRAIFERDLHFWKANIPTFIKIIAEAIIIISLALAGFQVWSIIIGMLAGELVEAVFVWIMVPYRPRLTFNREIASQVVRFGLPLSLSSLLAYFYWHLDDFTVGKLLGNAQLGYYWLAFKFPHYIWQTHVAMGTIVLPAFSRTNSDDQLKRGFEWVTKYSFIALLIPCVIVIPLGTETIKFVFGEKWLPATRAFQIMTVTVAVRGSMAFVGHLYQSRGVTWPLLVITGINTVVLTGLIYPMTRHFGIDGAALCVLITVTASMPVVVYLLKRLMKVDYKRLFFLPAMAGALTAGMLKIALRFVPADSMLVFLLYILAACMLYGIFLLLFDRSLISELRHFTGFRKPGKLGLWEVQQ